MSEFVLDKSGVVDPNLDSFTQGYIEALFFTEHARNAPTVEDFLKGCEPGTNEGSIHGNAGFADLAPETLAQIISDCQGFQDQDHEHPWLDWCEDQGRPRLLVHPQPPRLRRLARALRHPFLRRGRPVPGQRRKGLFLMPFIYQHRIYRKDLQANPTVLYVFGDNQARRGMGGQRGEPNAIGVATLDANIQPYSDDNYYNQRKVLLADFDPIFNALRVVFPLDGIVSARAPRTFEYLQDLIAHAETIPSRSLPAGTDPATSATTSRSCAPPATRATSVSWRSPATATARSPT